MIQTDGKIVAAGYSLNGIKSDFAIVRYNINGSVDNWFGTNGIVTTRVGNVNDYAQSVALQSDGKIVAAGYAYTETTPVFALVRYNTNGSLDNAFGTNGILTSSVGIAENYANAVAVQSDGNIVAAGYSSDGNNYSVLTLIRFNGSIPTGVKGDNNSATPTSFVLEQNYPNPFNPSTKIKYSIPSYLGNTKSATIVQLKIYDLFGREISTLVNEFKVPGNYEVEFNAGLIASGVYFYKFQAGSFFQTKKMILMK